jgi:cytochrome c biogenesis protein CcmG/thiol:disulfide interchange protein DsbE
VTRRRGGFAALLVAVVSAVLLFGPALSQGQASAPLTRTRPAPAPDLTLPLRDGGVLPLRSGGQVVVLNFFASWCAECAQEHADLAAVWSRFRDGGVLLVGVPFQDDGARAARFVRDAGGDWPVADDRGARAALALGVTGVPETVVIDRRGRVVARVIGTATYDQLAPVLTSLRGASP